MDTLAQMRAGDVAAASANGHTGESGSAISVLLAGTPAANPVTVLESQRLREILDELDASHDVLILDSAPLLSVTDAVPLVRYADIALVVGRLNLTTRDSARRMVDFLSRVPDAHVLGVVANDLTQLDSSGYGYSYKHGYGGTADENADAVKRRKTESAEPAERV
jgi:Mrp family chromosome partitioning ATPase